MSEYSLELYGVKLYFGSIKRMKTYQEGIENWIKYTSDSLSGRFHVKLDGRLPAMIQYYQRIERGYFHIELNGTEYFKPMDIPLKVVVSDGTETI